ncbi:MAG: hypothetical protein FJZ95_07510, partial [Chloroflexi bacterium]|nr:hypothetical protein [Chloroflexota bacterium]
MAQYNSEQPNNENHDWQSVAGEFAAKIASRHTGMAERIVSRAATPIQRITLSARSLFPKIARKIAGKANWSGAFVNRVSALADRISRAVQLTPAEREPIERVWFAPDQALEPEFMEEETLPSPKPPEAPRAIEAMPPTRAARVERQPTETQPARTRAATPQTVRPAPRVQRSPIAKTIRFAAAKQSRLERTPLVGFSRPTLESMGILPSRPSIAQRSIPMPSSREEIELPLRHAPVIERTPAPVPPGEAPSISRAAETGIRHEEPVEIAAKPLPTVPAYLKRIQEPFVPASIRGPAIARESAFEEIGERKPVSVGFVPPMKAFEEEPPRPSIAEALPFRPPMRE